jgi:surface polysaccharide O-acyltransferase-like enzyme
MQRNYSFDTLRTIAIILVLLLHISAEYVLYGKNRLELDTSFWIGNVINSMSRICVPLFIMISGMFLIGREETWVDFYKNRASRILWPFIFWTLIYLFYRASSSFLGGQTININQLIKSVLYGTPFYHLWYLYMIIGLYLITPVLNKIISLLTKRTLWLLTLTFLFIGFFNSFYDDMIKKNVPFILWFVSYLGYFMIGFLIKESRRNYSIPFLISVYFISSIIISILTFYSIKSYDSLYFYGYVSPFVIIGSLSIFKLFHQLRLKENIFSKFSHLTLGIYLIHVGFLDVLGISLRALKIDLLMNATIGIPTKFAIIFVLSIISASILYNTKYLNKII